MTRDDLLALATEDVALDATAASGEPYTPERLVREALAECDGDVDAAHAWLLETIASL